MDLKIFINTPPWEWPQDAARIFLEVLRDDQADESQRLLAVDLAGDFTVINDELADELLAIVGEGKDSDSLRTRAAISLGPALESAYIDEFEFPDEVPISENKFNKIQETLRNLYMDRDVPKEVRRRILEASVRAPQDWHRNAIREAYDSGDESWRLTAVFCMGFVQGFNEQILEALKAENQDIHYHAVCAAGNWAVDAAWSHIARLITTEGTEKFLLLAAIEAVAGIRPHQAAEIIGPLLESDDEDILDSVHESLIMTGEHWDEDENEDDDAPTLH